MTATVIETPLPGRYLPALLEFLRSPIRRRPCCRRSASARRMHIDLADAGRAGARSPKHDQPRTRFARRAGLPARGAARHQGRDRPEWRPQQGAVLVPQRALSVFGYKTAETAGLGRPDRRPAALRDVHRGWRGGMILTALGPLTAYRMHTPNWAMAPTSGAGAAAHGGRANRPGMQALYLALEPDTAVREYQQLSPLMPPGTLVSYTVQHRAGRRLPGGLRPRRLGLNFGKSSIATGANSGSTSASSRRVGCWQTKRWPRVRRASLSLRGSRRAAPIWSSTRTRWPLTICSRCMTLRGRCRPTSTLALSHPIAGCGCGGVSSAQKPEQAGVALFVRSRKWGLASAGKLRFQDHGEHRAAHAVAAVGRRECHRRNARRCCG